MRDHLHLTFWVVADGKFDCISLFTRKNKKASLSNLPTCREQESAFRICITIQSKMYTRQFRTIYLYFLPEIAIHAGWHLCTLFSLISAQLLFREFEVEIRRGIANRSFFEVIRFRESTNWCSFIVNLHFFILFNYNGIETQQRTGWNTQQCQRQSNISISTMILATEALFNSMNGISRMGQIMMRI